MAVARIDNQIPAGPFRNEKEYNMNHKRRGKAYIFGHYEFLDPKEKKREGNSKDQENLYAELSELGFEVEILQDMFLNKIKAKLNQISKLDHSEADCLVIAVLSHGRESTEEIKKHAITKTAVKRYEILAIDKEYDELELYQPFSAAKCPTLRGKPKIFFINACRGNKYEEKFQVQGSKSHRDGTDDNRFLYSIPDSADFLLVRATFNGTYSHRHIINGTLFIQSLCKELKENKTKIQQDDLMTLLTSVSRRVALTDREIDGEIYGQMPFILSTLMRLVYLRPKPVVRDEPMEVEDPRFTF